MDSKVNCQIHIITDMFKYLKGIFHKWRVGMCGRVHVRSHATHGLACLKPPVLIIKHQIVIMKSAFQKKEKTIYVLQTIKAGQQ